VLVLVMKSVTVAPARGAQLSVTVPEIESSAGDGGLLPPFGPFAIPLQLIRSARLTIASIVLAAFMTVSFPDSRS
jgi:hypothetical protein